MAADLVSLAFESIVHMHTCKAILPSSSLPDPGYLITPRHATLLIAHYSIIRVKYLMHSSVLEPI
jgi:hypothetical protein